MIKRNLRLIGKLIAFLMLCAMVLAGCATTSMQSKPTPIIAAVKAVPCRDLRAIDFAAPESADEEDLDNQIDTLETIRQIRGANVAFEKACKGR